MPPDTVLHEVYRTRRRAVQRRMRTPIIVELIVACGEVLGFGNAVVRRQVDLFVLEEYKSSRCGPRQPVLSFDRRRKRLDGHSRGVCRRRKCAGLLVLCFPDADGGNGLDTLKMSDSTFTNFSRGISMPGYLTQFADMFFDNINVGTTSGGPAFEIFALLDRLQ
jgi:hypothetical protein